MDKRERFMSVLKHGNIDRFPVQLDFSPKALDKIALELGFQNKEEEFLNFFGNHIVYAYLDDVYGRIKKKR